MKIKRKFFEIALCVGVVFLIPPVAGFSVSGQRQHPNVTPTPTPQGVSSPTPDPKLQYEIDKLKEETKGLKISNDALGIRDKWLTAWLTALGGIVVTLLAAIVGYLLNRTQRAKLDQDVEFAAQTHALETQKMAQDLQLSKLTTELENLKLRQDKRLAREKQLLEVFHDLGGDKPTIRIGAVATLVQRLTTLRAKIERSEAHRQSADAVRGNIDGDGIIEWEERVELPMIVSVLISATKHEPNIDIQKYIADGVAKGLGAIKADGEALPDESPLRKYDFQGAQLQNAWWKQIDARGVDFYKANLSRAGMRGAFLSGAILKNTDLTSATLSGADLTKADLQGADLRGTKLKGTIFRETKIGKARIKRSEFDQAVKDETTDVKDVIWDETEPPLPESTAKPIIEGSPDSPHSSAQTLEFGEGKQLLRLVIESSGMRKDTDVSTRRD